MTLLVRGNSQRKQIVTVTPELAGWKHVGFAAHRLACGESIECTLDGRETCVVVLSGTVDVVCGEVSWPTIGNRHSVFDDRAPYAVYCPPGNRIAVTAATDAQIALCTAPALGRYPARLLEPSSMKRYQRGHGLNARTVCDVLPQTEPAESLLVVEVLTPGGHSSSYPPHKHDQDDWPAESSLEETYYHRLDPAQGFAYQRVYTDDRSIDETMTVEDNDVVLVPRGYHPVTVPYGYNSYYLNVMAGPKRAWKIKNDPVHEWLLTKN
jgi:5-deoxy-glucuronate isomerase